MKTIEQGTHWTFVNNYLVTCLKDGTVTINSQIIAEINSVSITNRQLIAAVPEMFEMLDKLLQVAPTDMSWLWPMAAPLVRDQKVSEYAQTMNDLTVLINKLKGGV